MKIRWEVEDADVERIQAFMSEFGDRNFVQGRIQGAPRLGL